MDKEIFNKLKSIKRFSKNASFAYWTENNWGDISFFSKDKINSIIDKLNNKFIFVALNPADQEGIKLVEDFQNFHSPYSHATDKKLHYALKDTKYYGSYITDLYKEKYETDSGKMKNLPLDIQEAAIKDLNKEIEILGGNVTLIAMHSEVYKILRRFKKLGKLNTSNDIKQIYHYAYRYKGCGKIEKYVQVVRRQLKD